MKKKGESEEEGKKEIKGRDERFGAKENRVKGRKKKMVKWEELKSGFFFIFLFFFRLVKQTEGRLFKCANL